MKKLSAYIAAAMLLAILACGFLYPLVAQAADPDATFREAIRGLLFGVSGSPGKVLVMNASSNAALVAVSGDITIGTDGAVTLGARVVDGAHLEVLEPGYVFVGSATSNAEPVAVSGDVTIDNAGAVTLGARVVDGAHLEVLEPGYLFVGSATSNAEPVVVSGRVSMSDAGVTDIVDGLTTNFTFLSDTAATGRLWFADGVLTNVVLTGE